jgi:hypothetical protein
MSGGAAASRQALYSMRTTNDLYQLANFSPRNAREFVYKAATSLERRCGACEFRATRLDDIPAAAAPLHLTR